MPYDEVERTFEFQSPYGEVVGGKLPLLQQQQLEERFNPLTGKLLAESAVKPSLTALIKLFQSPYGEVVGGKVITTNQVAAEFMFQSPYGEVVGGKSTKRRMGKIE